jgi:hypothetical protein
MEMRRMRQFLKTALPLLALTGSMLIAQDDPSARQPPERGQTEQNFQRATVGKIVPSLDSNYVVVKYVLVDSAYTVYQLDDQTAAKKFREKTVIVSGAVDADNTIHVTDIKPAP